MNINHEIIDGHQYKLICVWRKNKEDLSKDSRGKIYPFPKQENIWTGKLQFLKKINSVQKYFDTKNDDHIILYDKKINCLLCDKKHVTTKKYVLDKYIWEDGLEHYIHEHNTQPDEDFIGKIFNYVVNVSSQITMKGIVETQHNTIFLKLSKNQLMILDALMKHGGYNKKYYDHKKENVLRYSEHAGFFDIRNNMLQNIIVSGNTMRVDRGDEEIFLPMNTPDALNYEYIFHTHPPTPKPGGRANGGILYEFPSIGDILHFIDHYNDGNVKGSLIMTPEGMYNIKCTDVIKKISIDEDKFFDDAKSIFKYVQKEAIKKYGSDFSTSKFYSEISQDFSFVNKVNEILKKYMIEIEYYPRSKDFRGSWIVDTIYIPLFSVKHQ